MAFYTDKTQFSHYSCTRYYTPLLAFPKTQKPSFDRCECAQVKDVAIGDQCSTNQIPPAEPEVHTLTYRWEFLGFGLRYALKSGLPE